MITRAAAIAGLLLLVAVPAARAQDAELDKVLERLGTAWLLGEAAAVVEFSSHRGISIELDGEKIGPLAPRQAAAVLRRLFESRETVSVRLGMANVVGGSPQRAFGEVSWTARAPGTTIPERSTVFFALLKEDGWKLTQIRVRP